jgi:NTE family protein
MPIQHALLAFVIVLTACTTPPVSKMPSDPVPATHVLQKKPPRIGLALGGGAARGFAHIGVIQVLEEAGIRPSLVVGTSAGSLVAAFYASGKTGSHLQQLAESMEEATFADWTCRFLAAVCFAAKPWRVMSVSRSMDV